MEVNIMRIKVEDKILFMRNDGLKQRAYRGIVKEILYRRQDGRPTYLVEVEGYEKLLEVACEKVKKSEFDFKIDVKYKIWQYENNAKSLKRDLDKLNLKDSFI
jgi:hypothetical protein